MERTGVPVITYVRSQKVRERERQRKGEIEREASTTTEFECYKQVALIYMPHSSDMRRLSACFVSIQAICYWKIVAIVCANSQQHTQTQIQIHTLSLSRPLKALNKVVESNKLNRYRNNDNRTTSTVQNTGSNNNTKHERTKAMPHKCDMLYRIRNRYFSISFAVANFSTNIRTHVS